MSKFRNRTSVVVNHTDNTLLPNNPRDRYELGLIYHHGDEFF